QWHGAVPSVAWTRGPDKIGGLPKRWQGKTHGHAEEAPHRGDTGRWHRQGSHARGAARARGREPALRHRLRVVALRLELRVLPEARPHDARGLVRDLALHGRDLLRCGRVAG